MASRAIEASIASWFFSIVFSMLFLMSSVDVGFKDSFDWDTTPSSYLLISSLRAFLTSKATLSYLFYSSCMTGCASAGVGVE